MAAVALVTGASSGIGAATASELAERGFDVALLGRNSAALSAVADSLKYSGDRGHLPLVCDVTDPQAVQAAIKQVCSVLGTPEAVVTAAGICVPANLESTTPALWRETIDANVTGTFLVAQATAAALGTAGRTGSFLFLGSEQSLIGVPSYSAYAASKAALVGLTRALAAELAPNIRVNLLCPGPVDTPMLQAEFALTGDPESARLAEERRVPLRRIASAGETARAAVWLMLDAQYSTGGILSLDGGTTGAFMAAG